MAVWMTDIWSFQMKSCTAYAVGKQGQAGRVGFGPHNTLTKHHINFQAHIIVGKLNAALSEGRDQYIDLDWLTTSNPANLLEDLWCCIEYLSTKMT